MVGSKRKFLILELPDGQERQFLGAFVLNGVHKEYPNVLSLKGKPSPPLPPLAEGRGGMPPLPRAARVPVFYCHKFKIQT